MSQENLELVERHFAAGTALMDRAAESTGSRVAAVDRPEALTFFTMHWHPQAVYDLSRRIDGGVYRGPAGVQQVTDGQLGHYEEYLGRAVALEAAGLRE